MRRFLLSVCVLMLAVPAFADNSDAVKYMNQSQGFAGFNKSLPQANSFKNLEKNVKYEAPAVQTEEIAKPADYDDYSDYDKDGYRIQKDEVILKPTGNGEKKVIKTLKDYEGKAKTNPADVPMTYEKFPQNYGNGDTMMMQRMMMPMGGMF